MDLIDINQYVNFMYYDDKEQEFKSYMGTIKEFLSTYTEIENLFVYKIEIEMFKDTIKRGRNNEVK